jgi:hypothetical protein
LVCARGVLAFVVLGDQESARVLCRLPHGLVVLSRETLGGNGVHVMTEILE